MTLPAALSAARDSLRHTRRVITDWLLAESSRLDRLEMTVSAQTDAWTEFDAQLQALQTCDMNKTCIFFKSMTRLDLFT